MKGVSLWKKAKRVLSILAAAVMAAGVLCMPGCNGQETESTASVTPGGDVYNGEEVEITVCDLITNVTGMDRYRYLRQQQFAEDYPNIKVNHINMVTREYQPTWLNT